MTEDEKEIMDDVHFPRVPSELGAYLTYVHATKRLFPYVLAFEGYFVLWGVLPHPTPKESMGFCLYPKTGCEFHL